MNIEFSKCYFRCNSINVPKFSLLVYSLSINMLLEKCDTLERIKQSNSYFVDHPYVG